LRFIEDARLARMPVTTTVSSSLTWSVAGASWARAWVAGGASATSRAVLSRRRRGGAATRERFMDPSPLSRRCVGWTGANAPDGAGFGCQVTALSREKRTIGQSRKDVALTPFLAVAVQHGFPHARHNCWKISRIRDMSGVVRAFPGWTGNGGW